MRRTPILRLLIPALALLAITSCPNPSSPTPLGPPTYVVEIYSNGTNILHGVAFGNGIFVAVGDGPTILTSPDGVTWTPQTPPVSATSGLVDVIYAGGYFVAVGGEIIASTDGVNWTAATAPSTYYGVAYGNGKFVAVGTGGGAVAVTSSPAGAWTAPSPTPPADNFYSVAFGSGTFVAVGYNTTGAPAAIWTSTAPDTTWIATSQDMTPYGSFNDVAFGGGSFVAVGSAGAIAESTAPGTTWTSATSGVSDNLPGIVYGGGQFVTVDSVTHDLLLSPDGSVWTPLALTVNAIDNLSGAAFGNNTYVVIGAPPLG